MNITKEQRDRLRQNWLAALRSGEYEQGYGKLQCNGKFCCLGVACEVFLKEFPGQLEVSVNPDSGEVSYNGEIGVAPTPVVDAFGLFGPVGEDDGTENAALIDLNDDDRLNFEEIAKELETGKYWKD